MLYLQLANTGGMKIGITIGDINGVGPEVIIKALANPKILNLCTPVIYGSSKSISYYKNIVKSEIHFVSKTNADQVSRNKINVINCWDEVVNISIGQATPESGKFAHIALDKAAQDLKAKKIDALVTGPINKNAMDPNRFPYAGHTEYLTEYFNASQSLMMMVSDELRIAVATNHIPISEIKESFTKELLKKKISIFHKSLKKDFGKEKPSIAVLGLNPHAGDGGRIGKEDDEIIRPVIIEMKKSGKLVMGPFSADGFFGSGQHKKFDGVLACYHDQGLVPFKTLTFGEGVNYTAGLTIVRTSPDHGTAYDISGKNIADERSMRNAIYQAIDIYRNRKDFQMSNENAVSKKPKPSEEVEE